jgi:error-prone DNA polymerase
MILSSAPLIDIVPVQRGAIEGRYVCQWDKDDIDDAGFVKIDFLALGALSQIQQAVELIKHRTGKRIDLSRIDFDDKAVYDMLGKGDTIGIFQVESAAQIQTITRLKPRNLLDMAHEVGAVRPGVGVNGGVQEYLARRSKRKPITYDHPLEKRALERTLGVVLFQDQVNQLAIDVAGFAPSEGDRLRRAFGRHHNEDLIKDYRRKFFEGAKSRGVSEESTEKIFKKFNGLYMFPESHAFAFGVTAYHASWLKYYYPLEFFVGLFNEQPMGFYNLETLKEDAKRHGVRVLNPDINRSRARSVIEDNALRLGFLSVFGLGETTAKAIEEAQNSQGIFKSIGDFLERTGVLEEVALNLVDAGAFDSLVTNRRNANWEIGLRYRPVNRQLALPLPVEQDMVELEAPDDWDRMKDEYKVLGLFPSGHVMAALRPRFNSSFICSKDIDKLQNGAAVTTVGLVIRRQRPHGKVVFITLEDEFGHIPCMVFPQVYEREELNIKAPLIMVRGVLSRREGTCNVVIMQVKPLNTQGSVPVLPSKDWR